MTKAAIITEEQIKSIEGDLDLIQRHFKHPTTALKNALALLKSLKVQEPVAWRVEGMNFHTQDVANALSHTKNQPLLPLYALGDEK